MCYNQFAKISHLRFWAFQVQYLFLHVFNVHWNCVATVDQSLLENLLKKSNLSILATIA